MRKLAVLLFVQAITSAMASTTECTVSEAMEAEETIDHLGSWEKLDEHFAKFGHCDDGSIAEGYSDVVSRLMDDNWEQFMDYEIDGEFSKFIIKHIDESWEIERYRRVAERAKQACRPIKQEFCKAILEKI